jgi:hypothetical protein
LKRFHNPILPERHDSIPFGLIVQSVFRLLGKDEHFHFPREFEDFKNSDSSLESQVIAFDATEFVFLVQGNFPSRRNGFPEDAFDFFSHVGIRHVFPFAMRAELPDELLGNDQLQSGDDHIGFRSQADEALDAVRARIRMERRQDEVSGNAGFHAEFCRLHVADFPDHDNVRILPENTSETDRKIKPDPVVYLRMGDSLDPVFDRILEGGNAELIRIEFFQYGKDRGRFPGSGRSNDQDQSVFPFGIFLDFPDL